MDEIKLKFRNKWFWCKGTNLSWICSICISVFCSIEPRLFSDLNLLQNSMHLLYLLPSCLGLLIETSYLDLLTEKSFKMYMQHVELQYYGNFSIINVRICKSCQYILVHCCLSTLYLWEAWKNGSEWDVILLDFFYRCWGVRGRIEDVKGLLFYGE
jgi:hypothetical protein